MAAAESFVPTGTWPDYNKMIGGFFKWHWPYPQVITVKIDDMKSPLTQMFHGQEFVIHDETYTMAQDSYSLKNVHELTSIDYSKMSQEDKDKEPAASRRTDGDYGLSWIRREGKGRVFIEVLGHDEHMYEMPVISNTCLPARNMRLAIWGPTTRRQNGKVAALPHTRGGLASEAAAFFSNDAAAS